MFRNRLRDAVARVAIAWFIAGCGKHVPPSEGSDAATPSGSQERAAPPAASSPEGPPLGGAEIVRREFRLRRVTLRIEDLHMKQGLDTVVRAHDSAVFAMNGGFFDPKGEPLGLALSNGRVLSRAVKKPGGILLVDDDRGRLEDAETFTLPEPPKDFGIQCLPRLVIDGVVNVQRDDGKHAERLALCLDDSRTVLSVVLVRGALGGGPSLRKLAEYLKATGCHDGLNLDGGPSAGIAWREEEKIRSIPPRGPIRHAIVIHTNDGPVPPP